MSEEILIRFTISGDEAQMLTQIAAREERKPNQQARYLLRQALRAALDAERLCDE